jgi:cytochrome c-type biogenesis protein CcmF
MVIPIGALLLFVLGVGPALPWGRASKEQVRKALLPPIAGAVLFTVAGYIAGARTPWTLITLAFGGYAAQVTLAQMFLPMVQRIKRGDGAGTAFVEGQLRRGRRRFGSYIVHGAVVVVIIAIAVSTSMRQTMELSFTKGQTMKAAGFDVTFAGVEQRQEPHRFVTLARFAIARDGKQVATLEPKMNQYQMMREPIGSPDVYTTAGGDFYLSLANVDAANQTATVTIFASPLIVWIWIAVILMGVGALVALIPPRPRVIPSVSEEPGLAGGAENEPESIPPSPRPLAIARGDK